MKIFYGGRRCAHILPAAWFLVAIAYGPSVFADDAAPRGEATGACCVGTVCGELTQAQCASLLGTYFGNGTTCDGPNCPAVVTLQASHDNTIFAESGLDSNGAGQHFFAGNTGGNRPRRALIQFDLSSIPSNATIVAAELKLYMSRTSGGAEPVSLFRVIVSWGEGASDAPGQEGSGTLALSEDATWTYRFFNPSNPPSSPAWARPGGDFAPNTSAQTIVNQPGFYYTWATPQMATDIQNWLDGTNPNHGWIMIGNEEFTSTAKRFDSRENPTPANRPTLKVYYTTPDPTGACCSAGGTCTVETQADCMTMGGAYQGDGSVCSPNPCVEPMGACCLNNGSCQSLTQTSCDAISGTYQGDGVACVTGLCPIVLEPFVDPLPIAAVAVPTTGTQGGEATYDIAIQQAQQQLHRDLPPTTIWGYNGTYPGPTIEATRDLPVTVNWTNDLRDSMGNLRTNHALSVDLCPHGAENLPKAVVHLHGGHLPAAFDGYPEYTWLPGQSETYVYPNNQLPATIWYHDHALGITRLNVYMGLAAFYIIRDGFEQSLDLPSGANEIALAIQDRQFNPDGSFYYPEAWTDHYVGDKILVNGKVWPYLNVNQGRYRFRILNGCNSRTLRLSLSDNGGFQLIGTDGGLLPAPISLTEITLGPAERADVVMDFASYAPGTEIVLTNSAPAPFPGMPGVGVVPNVMKFVVQAQPGDTTPVPGSLRPIETLQEADSVITRDFELRKFSEPCAGSEWRINDLGWDDVTEQPVLGTTEIWRFVNRSGMMHPMHMHLVMYQVLDRQPFEIVMDQVVTTGPATPPTATESGWKDTVQVGPFEIVRVIARFENYTGLFPYHCHILEHEDHEMMRQFDAICIKGDTNQDTLVNGRDIELFIDTLVSGGEPGTAAYCATDMDGSNTLDTTVDMLQFVDCLLTGNCP
ncbi:MAG: multicopper oxidase domain-containing protein [Phycisphaerales bacterium]|nr:multicopper oxidase domain-containing protein [Phycisphaerales bacterium]